MQLGMNHSERIMNIRDYLGKYCASGDKGAALLLAIMASIIMAVLGGSYALLVQNELRSSRARHRLRPGAVSVPNPALKTSCSSVQKNQADLCFPYDDASGLSAPRARIERPRRHLRLGSRHRRRRFRPGQRHGAVQAVQ